MFPNEISHVTWDKCGNDPASVKIFMIISSVKVLFLLYLVHTPVKDQGKRPKKPWVRKHHHYVYKEKQFVPRPECISLPF